MSASATDPPPPVNSSEMFLSRAECEGILVKACNTTTNLQLKEFSLAPAAYANGFLGEYYHLLLRYVVAAADENKNLAHRRELTELRAFVKRVPRASVEPEKEAIFRKEASLYRTLLEDLRRFSIDFWSPRCFYARNDVIVLEQLDELNYTLCPESGEYLSDQYLRRVMRGLAAQHASSLALESKDDICIGDVYPQLQQEITMSSQISWYTTGLRAILAVAKSKLTSQPSDLQESMEHRLSAAVESVYGMTSRSTKYRNVLCYRDIWRGNVFFSVATSTTSNEHSDQSVIFVDYQTARYCPPTIDVIFALFLNLNKDTRKVKEIDYLRHYFGCLERNLKANDVQVANQITYSELLASYEEFQLFGLLYRAIATTVLKIPRECVTNEYLHVERTVTVFKLLDELPEFRECLDECVLEMLEFILKENKYD